MAAALEPLKALVSFDTVGVTVLQSERTVYVETTAQQAMSSVLGLIMATAGCPWTDRLRPMARFHLPFANEAETLYRSVSMFLLSREIDGDRGRGRPALSRARRSSTRICMSSTGTCRAASAPRPTPIPRATRWRCSTPTRRLLPAALERSLEELEAAVSTPGRAHSVRAI